MKTPVRCMDCELDSHLFWTKRSHTRWIRQQPYLEIILEFAKIQEETLVYNIRRCSMGITIGDVSIYKRGRKEYNVYSDSKNG